MNDLPHDTVLEVEDLVIEFPLGSSTVRVLDRISLSVHREEILGVVGETGSGKSLTLLSIMGLLPPPGRLTQGSIRYVGRELTHLDDSAYRNLRGREISIVVQNAKSALNPLERIGKQIRNVYAANTQLRRDELDSHAREVLGRVGFRDVDRVFNAYPHQLSGGMAQRVLIAIAIGSSPNLVLVDEPTSGLDATVGMQVMQTLKHTIREAAAAGVVVTHDLGIVARFCDRVVVMKGGRIVDESSTATFFDEPMSPSRASLIDAHAWATIGAIRGPSDRPAPEGK
jgi:ABC-type glutathione transport system ATPase component